MSNMLTDTMHASHDAMDSAKDSTKRALHSAKDGMESAKEGTMQTITGALAMILKGVSATSGIITTLQKLDRDDGLAWLGLSRRKSPLLTIAILGAGAALGAGIALWFAPVSGAELRSRIMGTAKKAETQVEGAADAAVVAVKSALGDAKHAVDGALHNGKVATA